MRNRIVLAGLVLSGAAGLLLPEQAAGVPVFARKYGFECTMCHSSMPRLNDFGQRYRMNGYQLPDLEHLEKTVLESPAPVALRTSAGFTGTQYSEDAQLPAESDLRLNGLDLLSAGQLGRDIGYLLVYVPQIAEARGVAAQDGSLEMASIVFSKLGSSSLNVRVGRFEPAYLPFSVKRQLSATPYEVYAAAFPEGIALAETQTGVEISGYGPSRFQYAAGLVEGGPTLRAIDAPGDVYLRLATVIGAGEGQTAGHRLGVTGYVGRARPTEKFDVSRSPVGFYRIGVDASLNLGVANLALQYLMARDDQALWDDDGEVSYAGGFGELTLQPRVDLVCFARVDYLDAPVIANRDVTRLTAGGRFYAVDNVALHAELSHRTEKAVVEDQDDLAETFVTARVDFAF